MVKVLFLFPSTVDDQTADDIIHSHMVPTADQSPRPLAMRMSKGALMSPSGPAPYSRVVEIDYQSLDDVIAIGRSERAAKSAPVHKELGVTMVMYETEPLLAETSD